MLLLQVLVVRTVEGLGAVLNMRAVAVAIAAPGLGGPPGEIDQESVDEGPKARSKEATQAARRLDGGHRGNQRSGHRQEGGARWTTWPRVLTVTGWSCVGRR